MKTRITLANEAIILKEILRFLFKHDVESSHVVQIEAPYALKGMIEKIKVIEGFDFWTHYNKKTNCINVKANNEEVEFSVSTLSGFLEEMVNEANN